MLVGAKEETIELRLIDGKPDGMLKARIVNRTGHVLKTPRAQITEALKQKEASRTGVYLLLGNKDGKDRAYIGEADNVGDRIRNHEIKMNWWESAVLITALDESLAKSHVRYLESRLIKRARDISVITLENATTPPLPGLGSEAARASMEAFLETILILLPTIGVNIFQDNTRSESPSGAPLFELQLPTHGIQATAHLVNGEFVVQAGSLARAQWQTKAKQNLTYADRHAELVRSGILQRQGEHRVFTKSYAFTSPSAAASVVKGYTSTGDWKVRGQKKTYYQWESENLAGKNLRKQ
jgi:hypothetical protein